MPAAGAVAAHSSATDCTRKLAWTLQEVLICTTDHDLHLSCIYSQSFLSIASFRQEPPSRASWHVPWAIQGHQHRSPPRGPHDEEQRAEYRTLVNTNFHFRLFTVPLTNTDSFVIIYRDLNHNHPFSTLPVAISRQFCIDNKNIHNTNIHVSILCAWWCAELLAKRKIK